MKRNTLMKRFAAGMLAFSLIIPAVPASAHYNYDPYSPEKDGVVIKTTRIDSLNITDKDIVVDAQKKKINVKTNVEFYLDCSVDCDWEIEGLKINEDTGLITIPTGTAPGTYKVTATAKNIQTTKGKTWDEWSIVVGDQPAKADDIQLVPVEDEQVNISGSSIKVKGRVQSYEVETKVTPSYLDDKMVYFNCDSENVEFYSSKAKEGFVFLNTNGETSNAKISAEIGEDKDKKTFDEKFTISVEKLLFKAAWNVHDSELDSKITDGKTYNIPADKYAYFELENNSSKTIPYKKVIGCTWEFTNNSEETGFPSATYIQHSGNQITVFGLDKNNERAKAGVISYDNNGNVVVATTPEAKNIRVPEVQLVATIRHDADVDTDVTTAPALVLNLGGNGEASVSAVDFDFTQIGYEEGVDYSIRKEDIGSEKDVDVYYMNADNRNIDLSAVIATTSRNVISFENSRVNYFSDDSNSYSATFSVTKLDENAFGSITDKYQVKSADFWSTNYIKTTGDVVRDAGNNQFLLHKIATGYIKLGVTVKSSTKNVNKTIYVRLVSPSESRFSVEDPSANGYAYEDDEVVHIRKGEAVQPKEWDQSEIFSEYNEYADISFEDLAGNTIPDGTIVSVLRDNKGNIKINGLKNGFVKVIFTNRVNPTKVGYINVYVNNDDLETDEFEFNFDDAISKRYMTSTGVVNGKQSKIALRIRATGAQNNIGEWSASDFDFSIENDSTGEYAEIKDGCLVTKKATTDKIKIKATKKGTDISKIHEFVINDVKADAISKIGVKSNNTAVTAAGDNAGKCEVGTTFDLIPTELLPENATSSDITITDWASEKADIASVVKADKTTGTVTALAAGSTVITAHYSIGSDIKDLTYTLTVTESNKIKQIVPSSTDIILSRVQATAPIEFTTVPALDNPSVEFIADDPTIIDVNPTTGVITAKKVGTTKVTITSKDDSSVKAVVNVKVEGADDVVPEDKAVTEAKAAIDAIGTVTADDASKAKIDAARAAYNKLTDAQKSELGTTALNTLTSAETSYTTAKAAADKAAADKAAADKAAADKAAADKAAADKAAADAAAAEAAAKNIQNAKVKIKTAKNLKGKKIKVGVAKVDGAAGYQIKYSLKKNMKSAKTKNITKTSVNLTKLKKKTYYIQARAFSEYNGTKYYSKWSAKKKVTVKK